MAGQEARATGCFVAAHAPTTPLSLLHCYCCLAQERLARMFPEFAEAVEDGEGRWEGSAGRAEGRREAQGVQRSVLGDKGFAKPFSQ